MGKYLIFGATGSIGSKLSENMHESDKETPVVNVVLKPAPRLRVKEFEVNFADVSIKGRASKGNILTNNKVDKVVRKKGQLELL